MITESEVGGKHVFSPALDKLANSYAHIRDIVESEVDFQGRLENVIIDELQFALGLSSVTVWLDGEIAGSNMSLDEAQTLHNHFEGPGGIESEYNGLKVSLTHRHQCKSGPETMRKRVRAATHRYSALTTAARIDLFFCPEDLVTGTGKYLDFGSESHASLLSIISYSLNLISKRRRPETGSADFLKRILSEIKSSQYLQILLGKLKDGVLKHLRDRHDEFSGPGKFFIQFFFRYYSKDDCRTLRYFPLDEEIAQLTETRNVDEVTRLLRVLGYELPANMTPLDFITKYDWAAGNSFVGYVTETQSAVYLDDWTKEPLVKQPAFANEDLRRDRKIATTLMQFFRGETPDQFIVPFFYQGSPLGLMLVNCPEPIPAPDRLSLIRSVRSIAPQIYMAIDSDREVNHVVEEKRKAAEVRAYKYIVSAIMHEDSRFCRKVLDYIHTQPETFEKVQLWFMANEKKQAVEEIQGSDSPLRCVNDSYIYPKSKKITINLLNEYFMMIDSIYNEDRSSKVDLIIEPGLKSRGYIANLEPYIVARVMINLVKNSLNAARRKEIPKGQASTRLTFDLISGEGSEFLQITSCDNCGGFNDEQLKAWGGELTVDKYIAWLNQKDGASGMGLLIIAKYVNSTRGTCRLSNVKDPETGNQGARVVVRLKLVESIQ